MLAASGADLLSGNSDSRNAIIGVRLRFNDDSFKPRLSSLPISNAN
ncbi:MAG: hypothetical protein O6934_08900 [SAR324 cluster bacterium]|nr:hypothetical protein [SAR324 cluster bacterium]